MALLTPDVTSNTYRVNNSVYTNQTLIESFEDQNLDEYAGDKASFSIVGTTTKDGNWSLEGTGGSFIEVHSTSGLPIYPSEGDNFEVWWYPATGNLVCDFRFFYGDANNMYKVRCETDGNDLKFFSEVLGTQSKLAEDLSVSWDLDAWNRIKIETTTADRAVKAFNSAGTQIASLSSTNTDHTSGGIAFGHNATSTPATSRFDYARIVG